MDNVTFSGLLALISGIVCYVLQPLIGTGLHMAFVGAVSTMAGCAIAAALHNLGNWVTLAFGAAVSLMLFLGSLVMYLHAVDGVLTDCGEDIFCPPNQVLFWTAGMFVSVGFLVTAGKVKLA